MQVVYLLENNDNGRRYVGSTINFAQRRRRHFKDLKRGIHRNIFLQREYDKHGNVFSIRILEQVSDKNQLIEREQYWMDVLNPEYNLARKAGNCLGVKHRPEVVEANRQRGSGFGNGNCRIKEEKAREMIKFLEQHTVAETANKYGIDASTITRILKRLGVERSKFYSAAKRARFSAHAKTISKVRSKKAALLDNDGNVVVEFSSCTDLARHVSKSVATVSQMIKSKRCFADTSLLPAYI